MTYRKQVLTNMRLDDYRFYSNICLIFGIILIFIGVVVPIATIKEVRYLYDLFPPEYRVPYLAHGIIVTVVGIVLSTASLILKREHNIRSNDVFKYPPPPPPHN